MRSSQIQAQELNEKLFKMIDMLALINSTLDLDRLLQLIMRSVKDVMDAEASSLMALDPKANELYFTNVEGGSDTIKEIRIKADEGIAGHVIQTGQTMIINDVSKSTYFSKSVDKKSKFRTKSIICVQLRTREKPIGVLQAVNKNDGTGFTSEDKILFEAFANQVAVAVENAKLYNTAYHDSVTKAFRKRYVETWLDAEYERVKRYKTDLSLIIFEVDHFKKNKDIFGHQAGEFLLMELSNSVKSSIRRADVFGRNGGAEFVICMPETNIEKAKLFAERLRKDIRVRQFIYKGKRISMTLSFGVTNFKKAPQKNASHFLKDAKEALEYSKSQGSDQIMVFSDIPADKNAA